MSARAKSRMASWLAPLFAALMISGAATAAPTAAAGDAPIGRLGETLRVELMGLIADVTVHDILPSEVPPGFGYPPRAPRYQVYRANVTIHVIETPAPYAAGMAFVFRGVTPTGDAYEPRNSDAPDALQYSILNLPPGATATGGVWWDCYRDLVSNVVLIDKKTGFHLAQWNV
ncbi:hypothetical protein [Mycolicibacterium sp. 120270]|uniref:hypothetical protein n=1 Tax=Mycolicibacterium sp. 120270 TaxID=3090600 RepID=UPI0039AFC51C